jgi:hypothetical protein
MSTILELRLGSAAFDPLRPITESSGWLGDPGSGAAPWAEYLGDPASASWLPSQATAEEWEAFVGVDGAAIGSVVLEPKALIVHAGWLDALTATVRTRSGRRIESAVVHFTSDNEDVATLGRDDLCAPGCTDFIYVIGVAQGDATVTAEYNGFRATASVTVLPPFGSVKLAPDKATIAVGGSVELTATVLDPNGVVIRNSPVAIEWACHDCQGNPLPVSMGSVTVDANGHHMLVTGVAAGEATILAGLPGPFGVQPNDTIGTAVITVE